ncbi:MAG: SIR2 family protein [Pyrinomonadaceae bacterium]
MNKHLSGKTLEIIKRIEKGECTLFLGAGASLSAGAPTGDDLSATIMERLLHKKDWTMSVDHAFSLARANHNPMDVESFLRDIFSNLAPSPSHKMIPWFHWRALITTNYDQLIEKAYKNEPGASQQLISIFNENDLPKVGYSNAEYLSLLKPHGCISDSQNMSLGIEGIHIARKRRRLIFSYIEMLHLAGPVIYIGYSLRDNHILGMIWELRDRLGDRTDILFVTKQDESRELIERRWFERTLGVEYLEWGFEGFMDYISQNLTPAIGPSKMIPQLASGRILTFQSKADIIYKIRRHAPGQWECWIDYTINEVDGYVGIIFQSKNDPLDINEYNQVSFEINIPESRREKKILESIKLEGYNRAHNHLINIEGLAPNTWEKITLNFDDFKGSGVRTTPIRQVVFTDNGNLAMIGQHYRIGIRGVRLE